MAESIVMDVFGEGETLANDIAYKFDTWKVARAKAEEEWKTTREYIYATSTRDTKNSKLPYKNTTTTPKLHQLFEQLYTLAYNIKFSSEDFAEFESASQKESEIAKKNVMNAYMKKLLAQSGFNATALEIEQDNTLYGNAFAKVEFVRKATTKKKSFNQEEITTGFAGAKLVRISPFDIVFNASATSFANTPKIIRKVVEFASLKKQIQSVPDLYDQSVWDKVVEARKSFATFSTKDQAKDSGFTMDGFGSLRDYMESGSVEVLEFYGDIYDMETDTLMEDRTIIIVDRRFVLLNKQNDTEIGEGLIFHLGEKKVPDNLWHKSRLDNLIGLQYLIDKFNNGKADAIDLIMNPPIVIQGDYDKFKWCPGAVNEVDRDTKVQQYPVDTRFFQANLEVRDIMGLMENFAGLPSQAMGIKTKGEKTLGEAQMLDNSALRQFNIRVQNQERKFWQPIINCMFAQSRFNLNDSEVIKVIDKEGLEIFDTITRSDIDANGDFKAIGTARFDKMLKMQSYLTQLLTSPMMTNSTTAPHISGYELVKQFGELTGLDSKGVIGKNIGMDEALDVQTYKAQIDQELQSILAQMQQPTQAERNMQQQAQLDQNTMVLGATNTAKEMNLEGTGVDLGDLNE